MYAKCEKCRHKNRPKHIFPCNKCEENKKDIPITCHDCRYECNKKGIQPCKDFDWW